MSSSSTSSKAAARNRRWLLELDATVSESSAVLPASNAASAALLRPPGCLAPSHPLATRDARRRLKKSQDPELVKQSAMAIGTAPLKNIAMTAFMLYMFGSGIQIFSIMMLGMAFWNPIKSILSMRQTFSKFDDLKVDISLAKLSFVSLNLLGIGVALWQANRMGLLPELGVQELQAPTNAAFSTVGSVSFL